MDQMKLKNFISHHERGHSAALSVTSDAEHKVRCHRWSLFMDFFSQWEQLNGLSHHVAPQMVSFHGFIHGAAPIVKRNS